jgi:predicted glycosyltransferase involved in capsule biosynthesis
MDRFPEAFRRFENDVDVGRFESYHQLTLSFRWWAGGKWKGTCRQWEALNKEAENLGFNVPDFYREAIREKRYYQFYDRGRTPSWRRVTISIRGVKRSRFRDLKTGRFIKKP